MAIWHTCPHDTVLLVLLNCFVIGQLSQCNVWDAHMGSVILMTATTVPFYYTQQVDMQFLGVRPGDHVVSHICRYFSHYIDCALSRGPGVTAWCYAQLATANRS